MNESDEVLRWVHQKYWISWIIQKMHTIKKKSLKFMLPTVFGWIDEIMNDSDEVWRWVHQKYGMSRIIQALHLKKTTITFLLLAILYWIHETMNKGDEVWRWVNQKYWMSRILQKKISRIMHLSHCSQQCSIELEKQWMVGMQYEGECIKNMEWYEFYKKCIQ